MKDLHFVIQHNKQLRKQIDPEFRRQEREKDENFRVSQWLDRYIDEAKHHLGNEVAQKYQNYRSKVFYMDRRKSNYVEAQINFLYDCLVLLKEKQMEGPFHKIKNEILRTLSVQHVNFKRKIAFLIYK